VGLPELRKVVGFQLGYGRSGWSTAQEDEIDDVIQSGVRRVYYPPAVSPGAYGAITLDTLGYEWSWLQPTTTLSIVSGTGDYDLPDDFGRLIGRLYYAPETYRKSIIEVSVGTILTGRANSNRSGDPYWAATRFKSSDGTNGQRQEVLFYPEPDTDRTLTYKYEAYQGALNEAHPYPLGGMKLAELYIESCLAVAERRIDDEPGVHSQEFERLLVDAIARDKKNGATHFGQMGHKEAYAEEFRRGWGSGTYPITYRGESI
jgi:hypothetical protein